MMGRSTRAPLTRAGAGALPPSAGEASNDDEEEESEGDSGAGEEVNGEEGLCRVCAEAACEDGGDGAGGWECEGEARRGDSVVDMAANAESRESITEGTDGDGDGEGDGAGDDCGWRGFEIGSAS